MGVLSGKIDGPRDGCALLSFDASRSDDVFVFSFAAREASRLISGWAAPLVGSLVPSSLEESLLVRLVEFFALLSASTAAVVVGSFDASTLPPFAPNAVGSLLFTCDVSLDTCVCSLDMAFDSSFVPAAGVAAVDPLSMAVGSFSLEVSALSPVGSRLGCAEAPVGVFKRSTVFSFSESTKDSLVGSLVDSLVGSLVVSLVGSLADNLLGSLLSEVSAFDTVVLDFVDKLVGSFVTSLIAS